MNLPACSLNVGGLSIHINKLMIDALYEACASFLPHLLGKQGIYLPRPVHGHSSAFPTISHMGLS